MELVMISGGKNALVKIFNKLRYNAGKGAPFRFLVRNWSGVHDIDLLASALGAETWRTRIYPQALTLDNLSSIMIIAPHQDDELIGAGGLLIKAKKEKRKLTVAFVTNGAQNSIELEGKKLSPQEIITLRAQEAQAVCKKLKARYACLGVDNISMNIVPAHITALAKLIDETRPKLVLAPWIFDGSPKHRATNQILYHALKKTSHMPDEFWGYQVNNTPFANTYLDITDEMSEKLCLIEIYHSQNFSLRDYGHMTCGLNAWNTRFLPSKTQSDGKKYVEVFFSVPRIEFMNLIEAHYLTDFLKTYTGKSSLAQTMMQLAAYYDP